MERLKNVVPEVLLLTKGNENKLSFIVLTRWWMLYAFQLENNKNCGGYFNQTIYSISLCHFLQVSGCG